MDKLRQMRLENLKETYAKMKGENRKDYIASIVLERLEKEVQILEKKVSYVQKRGKTARKENAEFRSPFSYSQFFKEIFCGNWENYGRNYCRMPGRLQKSLHLSKEGAR